MGGVMNRWQTLLLTAYPDVDLLGTDPNNPAAVDEAVRAHSTGDKEEVLELYTAAINAQPQP